MTIKKSHEATKPASHDECLLSRAQVLAIVSVSYPTLWAMMREGRFPRSRKVGGGVRWLRSEVMGWVAALPIQELKPPEHEVAA